MANYGVGWHFSWIVSSYCSKSQHLGNAGTAGITFLFARVYPSTRNVFMFNHLDIFSVVAELALVGIKRGANQFGRADACLGLADNRHLNTLAEALPPLGILFVVLLMGGITPLVFGTVLGLLFQVIFLGASLLSCRQLEKPLFHLENRYRNMLLGGAGVMILGQGLMSGVVLVDQFAAAGLVPGSLATLGYANRILGLFLTLGSIVVARAVLPIFSAAYVSSNKDYNSLALQWGWKALCFGVVTAGTSILSADWIVKTLFQRGEFGTAESNIVSSALRYGFVQLPFFLCSTVLVNALLAAHRRSLLIPLGGLALATKLGFVLFFLPKLGLKGLLLSTAGAYCITSLAMIILFKRYAWQFAPKE